MAKPHEITNVHLSKFLPPLLPLEAEVGSGSPCWAPFSVLHIQVAQETWKQGKQIVLVWSRRGVSGMLPAPSAHGFIIRMLIKIPTFLSLSHPWPSAAFCFLRKVPGYCSAEDGSSPGIPGKVGVSPKPPALLALCCCRRGRRVTSIPANWTGRGQEGLECPRGGNHLLPRICSLSQLLFEHCLE